MVRLLKIELVNRPKIMSNQTLNIGDQIGFKLLASSIDNNDHTVFLTVCEITEIDGETAYKYEFPDGSVSRSAIPHSALVGNQVIRKIQAEIERKVCVSERRDEFTAAFKRGLDNNLSVFNGWDSDVFFVRNNTKTSEYRVELATANGKLYGECECRDFTFRKRVCKHISAVLLDAIFGMASEAK